jgi:hypothetical protein
MENITDNLEQLLLLLFLRNGWYFTKQETLHTKDKKGRYINRMLICKNKIYYHLGGGGGVTCLLGAALSCLLYSPCWFEPLSGYTQDYKFGICCWFANHAVLRSKSNDWLVQNQDNVSEWSNMSTHGLSFQWAGTIKSQLSELVYQ